MNDALQVAMKAVLAHVDDDAPRLRYAEVCEHLGDVERAEFVRLQIAIAGRARARDPDWSRDADRAFALRDMHKETWAGPIAQRVRWYTFFAGFVEKIALDARTFLDTAPGLCALAPIRRLTLTDVAPIAAELFASPYLKRIVYLDLEKQGLGDREIQWLAGSPHVGKLAWLDIAKNNITAAGVEALAASQGLSALKRLVLNGNPAEHLGEYVGQDWDGTWIVGPGPDHPETVRIEARYGHKTWLHTVADHGRRDMSEDEL